MGRRERAAAVLLALPFAVGATVAASASGPGGGHELCAFQDPAIDEASGIVAVDGLLVTMNDSGDTARAFAVDPATCQTVGVTHWDASPTDDEGLAPGAHGTVWVGDIGDNFHSRTTVTVTEVPVGRGDRTVAGSAYTLVYPDGPHDAETLLRDPVDGRLYVVSKDWIGRLYAAPKRLGPGENRLTLAHSGLLGLATDGAFFPDGKHLVLRNYGQAAIYTWPALDRVATFDLPKQQQGEGIGVGTDGRIYLSSEGVGAPVLQLALSSEVKQALAGKSSVAPASGDPMPTRDTDAAWPWITGGAVALLAAVLVGAIAWRRR
ncbi:hypothetical protein [Nocardioides montaniterrae]